MKTFPFVNQVHASLPQRVILRRSSTIGTVNQIDYVHIFRITNKYVKMAIVLQRTPFHFKIIPKENNLTKAWQYQ